MKSRNLALIAGLGAPLLAGCSGFVSTPIAPLAGGAQPLPADDGMYYYMPSAPIIVQVALDDKSNKTITVPSVSAFPDLSRPYLLTVPDNLISENHATLSVGTNGLLQSTGTNETSGVDTLVKNLAANAGTLSGLAGRVGLAPAPAPRPGVKPVVPPPRTGCLPSSTYSLVISPETLAANEVVPPICDLRVTVTKLGIASPLSGSLKASDYGMHQSGIFYKTEIPYLITVSAAAATNSQAFIAYSPNESPVQFAPLKKSMFAMNNTTIKLQDGVLTTFDSDVGGELTGLVALPADAISAYMTAIGNVFTNFKTNASDATGATLAKAQLQVCKAAVAANPIQGVSPTQQSANFATIKAACGG
jgi:hypothetical protein